MKRITSFGIGLLVTTGLLALGASAQNQDQSSLGDYARHARKAPGTGSKPRVYDNDNLPRTEHLSIIGPAPAATGENPADVKAPDSGNAATAPAAGEAKTATETKPPSTDGKPADAAKSTTEEKAPDANAGKSQEQVEAEKQAAWKQWADKITAQKEQIDLLQRELDVLQREYQIRAAAMYADAGNRLRNQTDWDKQDTQYKQQIADKQKALDDAKQKLEDLDEQARKAGVPSSVREP